MQRSLKCLNDHGPPLPLGSIELEKQRSQQQKQITDATKTIAKEEAARPGRGPLRNGRSRNSARAIPRLLSNFRAHKATCLFFPRKGKDLVGEALLENLKKQSDLEKEITKFAVQRVNVKQQEAEALKEIDKINQKIVQDSLKLGGPLPGGDQLAILAGERPGLQLPTPKITQPIDLALEKLAANRPSRRRAGPAKSGETSH